MMNKGEKSIRPLLLTYKVDELIELLRNRRSNDDINSILNLFSSVKERTYRETLHSV